MSSQAFPPQGGGGSTAKTNITGSGGTPATITVKANAITIPTTTNNGKDMPKTEGARTQLLADKQEGPRVVVQPAYPPISMPKSFSPSPPAAMVTATKVTIPSTVATTVAIKTPTCYIIPAKGPQGLQTTVAATAIATKLPTKQTYIPTMTKSILGNPLTSQTTQPAIQKIGAPVRIPVSTTTTSTDVTHAKAVVASLVTTTQSMQVKGATIPGLPGSTQAITATGVLPHQVLTQMNYIKGVSPMQASVTFPSHLPRGAAAAAAMTAPRMGSLTTALKASSVPVGNQVTTAAPTIIPPSMLQAATSLQRVPAQVHLSAQVPNRVHSPASLPGTTLIPRAQSPAGTTHTTTEPHRTNAHAAALQSLVSAAQARSEVTTHATSNIVRTDFKHDPKHTTEAASIRMEAPRAEIRAGTKPEIRQQARVEVRTIDSSKTERTVGKLDPRTDIRAAYTTYLPSSAAAVNAQRHPYMAGVPRMPGGSTLSATGHTMVHSVACSGVTSVSSSAVTTQSTINAVVRTTTVTATTMSATHPSTTTSNIPVAKVYPRQQHTTRPTTEPSTAVYLSSHRSSPSNPTVTSVSGLSVSVTISGDARTTERAPHQSLPAGYPTHLPYYFSPEVAAPYNMMRYGQHGPLVTMPNTMVRPTIDSHTRLPTTPTQNSSVAAAVAAAAHAAATVANTPPVRLGHHGPLMMIEQRGRPVTMQNSIPLSTADGSAVASFITSLPGGVYSTAASVMAGQAPSLTAVPASQHQGGAGAAIPNPQASPRPSILQRKRAMDSNAIRKPTVSTTNSQPSSPGPKIDLLRATNSPKATDSLSSSQHSVDSSMSEMSTDTVPTPSSVASLKIKQEPDVQGIESAPQVTISTTGESGLNAVTGVVEELGPSPRKKPRKQQHKVATEHPDILDDQSTDEETETKPRHLFRPKKDRKEKKHHRHDLDMKIVHYFRRPCCRLLDTYRQTWKPAHNHFDRYTDVKPKEDKRISIHEIANQRGVLKKTDGWKIRHITYQFDDLGVLEKDVHSQMKEIKDGLEEYQTEHDNKDTLQIHELIQGNIQRSQYVMEHLDEAKTTMLKLLEHKPKVLNIIKKHANKRHAKKKTHSS